MFLESSSYHFLLTFYNVDLFERQTDKRLRHHALASLLSNPCNSLCWARPKPGDGTQSVSCMWYQGPNCLNPSSAASQACMSNKLELAAEPSLESRHSPLAQRYLQRHLHHCARHFFNFLLISFLHIFLEAPSYI